MKKQIVTSAMLVMALLFGPVLSYARDYNAHIGRFQTMDTYEGSPEDPQSLHKYVYCNGDPVNNSDPSGHIPGGNLVEQLGGLAIQNYLRASEFVAKHPVLTLAAVVAVSAAVPQLEAIPPGHPGPFDEMGQAGRAIRGTSSRSFSIFARYFQSGNRAVAATTLLAGAGDELAAAAKWVKPRNGYYDVIVHGSEEAFHVLHNGQWVEITHRSLAEFMKKNGYTGGPVRLISCSTGGSSTGVAKNLANKLGTEVIAPTDTIWIHPSGDLTIGATHRANTGIWETFTPGIGE